jgi:dipeptidase D
MPSVIEGLKPESIWKYFLQISRIPRGSKHEAAISGFVLRTARNLGLKAMSDSCGNVVVRKPASPGREKAPSICLQGHLDMVCEKNKDKKHDFLKDPIEVVRENNVLKANGTTLGADNGIGVATALAIMEDRQLEHGPLELLFTVDEETGLTGANNLPPDFIESRTLVNLDSEEEGSLFVGCSGGKDTQARWKLALEQPPAKHSAVKVTVRGLRGGHSGLEIDKGRGNAIKILTRIVVRLTELGARLAGISGGNKRNAIPREAEAVVLVPEKNYGEAMTAVAQLERVLKSEVASVDPELTIVVEKLKGSRKPRVLKRSLQKRILQSLTAVPHGVIKMSADLPGLVETSTNLAVITTSRNEIAVATSQRSSIASEIEDVAAMVRTVFEMGGAEVQSGAGYPGWKPDMTSRILNIARTTYLSLYGSEPAVKAIHAGLECGIIGEKYPGMDMVSFGPTLEGVHTPDEKIYIETVGRFWTHLTAVLRAAC